MAELESPQQSNFMEKIRKSDGYDVYTESALARLAARYESSTRIDQITRTLSSPVKEPKGWRDQFMCMISTRRQKQLHRRDWRSRSVERERNKSPVPALVSGNSCSNSSCSIATVPRLRSLSTIEERLSGGNRPANGVNRGCRGAKEKAKPKKLRSGRKPHPEHKRSSKPTADTDFVFLTFC